MTTLAPPVLASTGEEAALAAATETVLNCYLRETGGDTPAPAGRELRLPIRNGEAALVVGVRYWSPTLRHRYDGPAHLVVGDGEPTPLGFLALAGLLFDELGAGRATTTMARMLASVQSIGAFLDARRADIDRLWSADPLRFIESEQALLLGHPLHPTPKSRSEMGPDDHPIYSPETQGRFQLRWLAARPDAVRHDSATGTPAPALVAQMLRADPATDTAALDAALAAAGGERILVPAHPWELDHLRRQPEVAALFADGTLVDVGPHGSPVTPTTSVRTVYQESWQWQLKFSLHVSVTNSVRVTLPKELERAVEASRLHQSTLGREAARLAPALQLLDDPAFLSISHDNKLIDGFSVLLRHNRWPGDSSVDVSAVTTLCQDHPFGTGPSRLGAIVRRLADDQGMPLPAAGRTWFGAFCDVAVVSLVRLYLDAGLCFEAHQQNTLLELDRAGLPQRAVYRDSQGYFHREAAHADVCRVLPGLGEASESIFPEELADERLVYYPFLNLTLGVINALGAAGCADERELLDDLRRCLTAERARGGRYPATLLDRLLDDPRWPCKANLRTRLGDLDELVGDIETQSVYVTIPNPLVAR